MTEAIMLPFQYEAKHHKILRFGLCEKKTHSTGLVDDDTQKGWVEHSNEKKEPNKTAEDE